MGVAYFTQNTCIFTTFFFHFFVAVFFGVAVTVRLCGGVNPLFAFFFQKNKRAILKTKKPNNIDNERQSLRFDRGNPDGRIKKKKGNKYEEQRQNLKVSLYKTTLTRTIPRSD